MATFRKIHVSFWSDTFVQDLTPEQKYFYLYLMTNNRTTQCGIYEISKRQMCYDTGYNTDTINKLLEFFKKAGKVLYSDKTSELALKNWGKYNDSRSPKVKSLVDQELMNVKDTVLIQYVYSMDTVSAIEEEKEEEKEEEENKNKRATSRQIFTPPQKTEVIEFLTTEKNLDEFTAMGLAERWWNFYDSKDWMIGKNKMKKWKSAVNTWLNSPEYKKQTNRWQP